MTFCESQKIMFLVDLPIFIIASSTKKVKLKHNFLKNAIHQDVS